MNDFAYSVYSGAPDEFAHFSIGDTTFTIITAPERSLNPDSEVEIVQTLDDTQVLILVPQERMGQALPEDMPDTMRTFTIGMLMGAFVALAERWLAKQKDMKE